MDLDLELVSVFRFCFRQNDVLHHMQTCTYDENF